MYIKPVTKPRRGYTLVEMMVAVGVFSISGMALASIFIFTTRSFAALSNYAMLDQANRQTMDQVTREIRQAAVFQNYTSNATSRTLTILTGDSNTVSYTFDSNRQWLLRNCSDGTSKIMITNCNLLNFTLGMRPPPPPTNTTFDLYYPPDMTQPGWQQTVKVIRLTWKTAIALSPTANVNSEDVQTAYIVIRKQQ
ncbi:MAG TPA: prepilin-type N-terminal cleavage/methylation domain-containing protein [Candidatus Binatia bacterium]|jgi:prepilin-type N-terminal cleavage/methylation domain-containing protein|nr:prepilin-type N-terminal cleavage/methylation domain-containing protein [Candidatus Binatia bacterium]